MSRFAVAESPAISMATVWTKAFTKYIHDQDLYGWLFAKFTPVQQLRNQLHS